MRNRLACAYCIATLLPLFGETAAQIVPVKTVPVAEGDQFTFLPSANRGMAGVSIALSDSLLDPFNNPATGAKLRRGYWFGSPSFYTVSRRAGNGSTLPLGGVARRGSSFGGVALAVQELSPGGEFDGAPVPLGEFTSTFAPGSEARGAHTNRYAFAMLGHALAKSKLSFAGSVFWSRLTGVDGVELLYPGSQSVAQLGDAVNLRVGMVKEWKGDHSLEALIVHNRYATTHDVSYLEFFWDPATRQPVPKPHVDHNYDRTHMWGLHLEYERPLADSGWRVGAMMTGNRTTHPTIPSFGIMNIARDPGQSAGFNVGVGLSRSLNTTLLGVDAIYEPIWSRGQDGANDKRYRFSNTLVRTGVSHDFMLPVPGSAIQLQFGMQLRAIQYALDQHEALLPPRRTHERWNEWTHTWAMSFRTADFLMNYQWRLNSGVERLGFLQFGGIGIAADSFFPGAPQMTTLPVRVTTQQFSISVPIR